MTKHFQATIPDADYWVRRVPCQTACPVHTDGGRYVQLIADRRDSEAYLTARSPNPLASTCGRVCAAPCEDRCRRGLFDAPVSIRALKRFVTEQFGVESRGPDSLQDLAARMEGIGNKWPDHMATPGVPFPAKSDSGKVAVVGAGPAGLACAHDLALLGHQVTVFEATSRAGGMAVHGIPDFRLPPSLLDKEIQAVEDLGVTFRFNTPLTETFGLQELRRQGFEAFFLSVGTQKGRFLKCPGSELDGIVRAVEYLINLNNGYRVPKARKVLVIGGGFVAFDAARLALRASSAEGLPEDGGTLQPALDAARLAARAGAEVTLISLESFDEMPVMRTEQGKEEFEESRAEGIRFLPQRSVARFEGVGHVSAAQLVGVKTTYDQQGRFAPILDERVQESVEADLVILAIGQEPDLSFLSPADQVETGPGGTIRVDPETLATSAPGVFAGGDAAFGPRNLIDAVANGKLAARSIASHLSPGDREPRISLHFEKIPTWSFIRDRGYEKVSRSAPPTTDLNRRTGISEVEVRYEDAAAREQAARCLACHIQTIYDPGKCVLCNRCVDVCPEHCLKLVPLEDLELPEEEGIRARDLAGASSGGVYSAMLKDDERCIRCGLCAVRCPTDAMTMEVLYYERR